MICPKCDYQHGFYDGHLINGEYGYFFKLPIMLKPEKMFNQGYGEDECRYVYGCPRCLNLFMEE